MRGFSSSQFLHDYTQIYNLKSSRSLNSLTFVSFLNLLKFSLTWQKIGMIGVRRLKDASLLLESYVINPYLPQLVSFEI